MILRAALAATLLLLARPATAQPAWPDSFLGRVEALAVMQTLNATLLASRSATFTLEAWCADHHMAATPRLRAELVRGVDKPPSPDQRRRLQVDDAEVVKYRRVRLACGDHVLSEADNWYVPARLTPEMNRLLEQTDTPFGRAVADLKPFRQTFAMETLWSPLPAGWDLAAPPPDGTPGKLSVPPFLFVHHAVLTRAADQMPFSEVAENYTVDVLAFDRPGLGSTQ